jgi:16S rRNA (guanine(966)-N(2))-methyltransferase RsmD
MRVVAGSAKGTKLRAVPGTGTRPILDRVKTALFDILQSKIGDAAILDLFAGSGGVGIEALSRSAAHCTFIDNSPAAINIIRENLERCRLTAQANVLKKDAFNFITSARQQYDLIYVAPPQYHRMWLRALAAIERHSDILNADGIVIAQIDPKEYQPQKFEVLVEQEQRRYGSTLLVFYKKILSQNSPLKDEAGA